MMGKTSARKGLLTVIVAAAVWTPVLPAEAQEASWFHIRVEDPGATRVSLNLPLSLVEIGLDVADRHGMRDESLRWGRDGAVNLGDLRRMWAELQAAGDVDFVEVVEGNAHVRISRQAGRVHVRVDEGDTTMIRMEMPSTVVDALLGGEGDRLDLQAAVRELARNGRQELLDIRDGETTIRIWIDEGRGS